MEEKLYAIYGAGAVPQTPEMLMGKIIFYNRPVGEYSDGQTVYRVWFLEPPSTQEEANEIARKIAEHAPKSSGISGSGFSETDGTIALAVLGITVVAGLFQFFFGKKKE